LHLDRDLGDPIPASPGDEQRLEGVTEVVRREVMGEGSEQRLANRPKARGRVADRHSATATQRCRQQAYRGATQLGLRRRDTTWCKAAADDHVEVARVEMLQ